MRARCASRVEAALPLARVWQGATPRERALEVFGLLRVWDTERNDGVLVYLLLADRDVEIVADRGIHARVGEAAWEAICARDGGGVPRGPLRGRRRAGRVGDRGRCSREHSPRAGGGPQRAVRQADHSLSARVSGARARRRRRRSGAANRPCDWLCRWRQSTSSIVAATNRPNITIARLTRHAGADHERVEADHHEDADVLVEVLHGDRVAGAHQHVAAMLQQRVHRHDEEPGAGADRDHQHDRERQLGARRSSRSRRGPSRRRSAARSRTCAA